MTTWWRGTYPSVGPALSAGPTDGYVQLWLIDLTPDPARLARAWPLLQPEERQRANRYVVDPPRHQFVLARAATRQILSDTLTLLGKHTSPQSLRFGAHQRNKPNLAEPHDTLCFNLTHSHHGAILAVGIQCQLGVDLEFKHPKRDIEALSQTAFSPLEQQAMAAQSNAEDKQRVFFQTWTRKEAYLKAMGMGLAIDLKSFDVEGVHPTDAHLIDARHEDAHAMKWSLRGLPLGDAYEAALAHDLGESCRIEIFQYANTPLIPR